MKPTNSGTFEKIKAARAFVRKLQSEGVRSVWLTPTEHGGAIVEWVTP